jgi:hypothetical protein
MLHQAAIFASASTGTMKIQLLDFYWDITQYAINVIMPAKPAHLNLPPAPCATPLPFEL